MLPPSTSTFPCAPCVQARQQRDSAALAHRVANSQVLASLSYASMPHLPHGPHFLLGLCPNAQFPDLAFCQQGYGAQMHTTPKSSLTLPCSVLPQMQRREWHREAREAREARGARGDTPDQAPSQAILEDHVSVSVDIETQTTRGQASDLTQPLLSEAEKH